jgi:hypothetical protein
LIVAGEPGSRSSFLILSLNFFECVHHFLSNGIGILPSLLLLAKSKMSRKAARCTRPVERISSCSAKDLLVDAAKVACSYGGRITAIHQPAGDRAVQRFAFLLDELYRRGSERSIDCTLVWP